MNENEQEYENIQLKILKGLLNLIYISKYISHSRNNYLKVKNICTYCICSIEDNAINIYFKSARQNIFQIYLFPEGEATRMPSVFVR